MTATARQRTTRKERVRPRTMALDLAEHCERWADAFGSIRFPCVRYQTDPRAFFVEILGVDPCASGEWGEWRRSLDLIEAVRDNDRVAVKAGRKVGKSFTLSGLALWFFCAFAEARVIMTSTTAQQVERVLWVEIRRLYSRSGKCLACKIADPNNVRPRPCPHSAMIGGNLGELPHTGLKVNDVVGGDFREIFGFTAKQGEAVQGMSGVRMMYIIDEASGIPDFVYDAIEGNRAGGCKVILAGNPTKNDGEFYDAFHDKQRSDTNPDGYVCLTISSEESPNVLAGSKVVPGLAMPAFITERRREWGIDSPLYKVHVLGQFAEQEEGCAFSIHDIAAAQGRWSAEDIGAGRLYVGLDPAGESGMGDETCFTVRRGLTVYEPIVKLGLSAAAHKVELLRILRDLRIGREVPIVTMDRAGSVGADLYGTLVAHLDECERKRELPPFELVGIRGNDKAGRQPYVYATLRDELAAGLAEMMRAGLAIPPDPKLEKELHTLQWRQVRDGLYSITSKIEIKKAIGRSPDRCDSLQLACWEEGSLLSSGAVGADETTQAPSKRDADDDADDDYRAEDAFDPYAHV